MIAIESYFRHTCTVYFSLLAFEPSHWPFFEVKFLTISHYFAALEVIEVKLVKSN